MELLNSLYAYYMNNLKGNIPQSSIKGSGFVNTDLDFKNNGEKLLFTHPNCVIVGLDDLPYMLFLTPDFDQRNLPSIIKEKIYEVKKIVLKATFSDDVIKKKNYYSIPDWLINFYKVECIDFENADLDNLALLSECPIKYFIFHNVKFDNKEKIASTMRQFKELIDVSCDPPFFLHFENILRELNINILPISEET